MRALSLWIAMAVLTAFAGQLVAETLPEKLKAADSLREAAKPKEAAAIYEAILADRGADVAQKAESRLGLANCKARLSHSDKEIADALAEYQRVWSDYPQAPASLLLSAHEAYGNALAGRGDFAGAADAFRKVWALCPPSNVFYRARWSYRIACAEESANNRKAAVQELENLVKECTNAPPDILLDPARMLRGFYADDKRWDDAIAMCRTLMVRWAANNDALGMCELSIAQCLEQKGDRAGAIAEYEKLMKDFSKTTKDCLAQGYVGLGRCYSADRRYPQAAEAYLAALDLGPSPETIASVAAALPSVARASDQVKVDDVCGRLRGALLQSFDNPARCEAIQTMLVTVLLAKQQLQDAAFEGKILLDVCAPANVPKVVDVLAQVFKATDRSVVRLNQLLEYQKYGRAGPDGKVGTADDLADPLAGAKCTAPADRDKAFEEGLERYSKDWEGRLARANVCRYWGKPKEALKELDQAYMGCPATKEALQRVTDRTVELLVQVSGNPSSGERFVAYQKYGPNGPDGKAGTADDLTNPLDEYVR